MRGGINVADSPPSLDKPKSISIIPSDYVLDVGDIQHLHAVALPEGASQLVTWHSSDPSIVSVDDSGIATCHEEGSVVITAQSLYYPHIKGECNIGVRPLPTMVEILNREYFDLNYIGNTKTIEYQVYPLNANQHVAFSSSNKTVATVNESGTVTFLKSGALTLTVTTVKGLNISTSMACDVYAEPTNITLDIDDMYVLKGYDYPLKATISPSDAYPVLDWNLSDNSIATLVAAENHKDATVNGIVGGNGIITVTTQNGKTATCDLTVRDGFRWIDEYSATPVLLSNTGVNVYDPKEDAIRHSYDIGSLLLVDWKTNGNKLDKILTLNYSDTLIFEFETKFDKYYDEADESKTAGGTLLAYPVETSMYSDDYLKFYYDVKAEGFYAKFNMTTVRLFDKNQILPNTKYKIKIMTVPIMASIHKVYAYIDDIKISETMLNGVMNTNINHLASYPTINLSPRRYVNLYYGWLYYLKVIKETNLVSPDELIITPKVIEAREESTLPLSLDFSPSTANYAATSISSQGYSPNGSTLASGITTRYWGNTTMRFYLKDNPEIYDDCEVKVLPVCPMVNGAEVPVNGWLFRKLPYEQTKSQSENGRILTGVSNDSALNSAELYSAFHTSYFNFSGSYVKFEMAFTIYDNGEDIPKFVLYGTPYRDNSEKVPSNQIWDYFAVEGNELAFYYKRNQYKETEYNRVVIPIQGLTGEFNREYIFKVYYVANSFYFQVDDNPITDTYTFADLMGSTQNGDMARFHTVGRAYESSKASDTLTPIAAYPGEIRYYTKSYFARDSTTTMTSLEINKDVFIFTVIASDDYAIRRTSNLTSSRKIWPSEAYQYVAITDGSSSDYFYESTDNNKVLCNRVGSMSADYQLEKFTGVVQLKCSCKFNTTLYDYLDVTIFDRPTSLSINIPSAELSFPKENTTYVEYMYEDYMDVAPLDGSPRAKMTTATTGDAKAFTVESRVDNMGFRIKSNGNYAGSTITLTFTSPDNVSIPASSVTFTMV